MMATKKLDVYYKKQLVGTLAERPNKQKLLLKRLVMQLGLRQLILKMKSFLQQKEMLKTNLI